jgi:polyferredoxin
LFSLNVLHERNPLFVTLSDGSVRNDYTLRLLNKSPSARSFLIEIGGLPGATVQAIGIAHDAGGGLIVNVGQDQTEAIRLSVLVAGPMLPAGPVNITIRAKDLLTGLVASSDDHFIPANNR